MTHERTQSNGFVATGLEGLSTNQQAMPNADLFFGGT